MARITLQSIGRLLKERRGERGLKETASEIGISVATLSRIERGNLPDLDTFAKICRWLKVDPAEVLNVPRAAPHEPPHTPVAAHFRADRNLSPEAAQALGQMILAAYQAIQTGTLK